MKEPKAPRKRAPAATDPAVPPPASPSAGSVVAYCPPWSSVEQAGMWLAAHTGEAWPPLRVIASGVDLTIWIEPASDMSEHNRRFLFGDDPSPGFSAHLTYPPDVTRLLHQPKTGLLTMTYAPNGHIVRFSPSIEFDPADLRVTRASLQDLARAFTSGGLPPQCSAAELTIDGYRVRIGDPALAMRIARGMHSGLKINIIENLRWVAVAPAADSAATQAVAPKARHRVQEEAILAALLRRGVDPLRIPTAPKGNKAWPLRESIRIELNYTQDVLLHAWKRLRSDGRIKYAEPRA